MKSKKQLQEEREESLGYDNSKSHICKHAYPRELCGTCNPIKPLTEPSSDPNSETNTLWRKHVGFSPQSGAAAYELCGKLEKERDAWKHNAKLLADELKSENEKAIDWFIHANEIKEDLRNALQWIDDGNDQEGRDLIVGPLRAKHFPPKAGPGLDSENA